MPRDDNDDDWDEDWPDEPDESGTITCSQCGADVYEDSPRCPICGEYLSAGPRLGSAWQGKPAWYVLLGLLGIMAVIVVLLFY